MSKRILLPFFAFTMGTMLHAASTTPDRAQSVQPEASHDRSAEVTTLQEIKEAIEADYQAGNINDSHYNALLFPLQKVQSFSALQQMLQREVGWSFSHGLKFIPCSIIAVPVGAVSWLVGLLLFNTKSFHEGRLNDVFTPSIVALIFLFLAYLATDMAIYLKVSATESYSSKSNRLLYVYLHKKGYMRSWHLVLFM